jgi:hypothetical protein
MRRCERLGNVTSWQCGVRGSRPIAGCVCEKLDPNVRAFWAQAHHFALIIVREFGIHRAACRSGRDHPLRHHPHRDRATEQWLNDNGITVIRPAYRTDPPRPGRTLLRAVRQSVESVNNTLKDQLDLERHGGRTPAGVTARVLQRILALTPPSGTTGTPANRSCDHSSRTTTDPLE